MTNCKKSIKTQLIDFVIKNGPTRRCDIIKYLRETVQGKDYVPIRDRGYYCVQFYGGPGVYYGCGNCYMVRPSKADRRFLKKNADGLYVACDSLN